MSTNNHWNNNDRWDTLVKQLCSDFGPDSTAKIIETIVYTIGGERITMPSIYDLERRARDRKICDVFRGDYREIAVRFALSMNQVRRIIKRQRMIDRSKRE